MRIRRALAGIVAVGAVAIGSEAWALPLVYEAESDRSEISGSVSAEVVLTILVNYPPATAGDSVTLSDSGALMIPLEGSATVETGLPGGFDGGAHGIEVSALEFGAEAAPEEALVTLSDADSLGGWAVSLDASVNAISLTATESFSAALVGGAGPDEFTWGPVDVETTIVIDATLLVDLPTAVGFPVWDGPIAFPFTLVSLSGSFSGTDSGTELAIVVDVGDLMHEAQTAVGYYSWADGLEASELTAEVVMSNPTTLPEPGSRALVAMASVLLAWLRSRRR